MSERAETVPGKISIADVHIPWGKWLMILIAFITVGVLTMGTIWGGATLIASKADRSDLHVIQEKLHSIETSVAVIKRIVEDDLKE